MKLVAANSHSMKPDMYRFTGVWANHEGSLLLWVLVLSLWGAAVSVFGKGLPWEMMLPACWQSWAWSTWR